MDVQILDADEWLEREKVLHGRLSPHVEAFRDRRARGHRDVVADFLFDYYAIRSRTLLGWTPGIGAVLTGEAATRFGNRKFFNHISTSGGPGFGVTADLLGAGRRRAITWIRTLLESIQHRPPFLGCAGMHEWAMIGADGAIRHGQLPLRFSQREIGRIVRSNAVVCSHYDAFRFFAPENRDLNVLQPNHDTIPELEQPGCLHVNMDVLRWSLKLYPFVPSELIADAFELAIDIREVDMRASPYDLRAAGLQPIAVETPEGKTEFRELQRVFLARAHPLRAKLLGYARTLEDAITKSQS